MLIFVVAYEKLVRTVRVVDSIDWFRGLLTHSIASRILELADWIGEMLGSENQPRQTSLRKPDKGNSNWYKKQGPSNLFRDIFA